MRSALAPSGSTRRWRKLRAWTLARRPLCEVCRGAKAKLLHHVVPRTMGGSDAQSNLRALCEPCHQKVHGQA